MEQKPKPTCSASSMVWERISIETADPDNIRFRLVKVFQSREILWHPKHTTTDQSAVHRAWKEVVKFTNIHGLTVKNAKLMIREIIRRCKKQRTSVDVFSPEWLRLAETFLTRDLEVQAIEDDPMEQKSIVICRGCLREYEKGDENIMPLISTYINRVLLADIYRELVGEDETISHTSLCSTCKNILLDFWVFRMKCRKNSAIFHPTKPPTPVKMVPTLNEIVFLDETEDEGGNVDVESMNEEWESVSSQSALTEDQSAPEDIGDEQELVNGVHAEVELTAPTARLFYYCHHCNRCYTNKNHLKTHILTQHIGQTYTCQYCDKVLKSPSALQKHLEIYHVKLTIPCSICAKLFGTVKQLRAHLRTVHIQKRTFQCSECQNEFTSNAALYQHRQSHLANLELPCGFCKRVFGSKSYLQRHIQRCHSDVVKNYPCPVCEQSFGLNLALRTHLAKKHPNYRLPPQGSGSVLSARALERSARVYEQHKFEKIKHVWKSDS